MNRTLYLDKSNNALRVSQFNQIDEDVRFAGIGVKYVVSGEEVYFANQRRFTVREGEYIIGNDFTTSSVRIDHPIPVQGICVDISPEIITEVAEYHALSANELSEFLLSDQFLVNTYKAKNTSLGYSLRELNTQLGHRARQEEVLRVELFYSLAESIITDQRFVLNHLSKLNFKKAITNEEVLRSLLSAREVMDDSLAADLSLDEISAHAGLSKYHFIRLFKSTFGMSPYQYIRRRGLEAARIDLQKGHSLTDVAVRFGFADSSAFSKAFRKEFGSSPGSVRK
ncbi:MAG: helix-turn-helix transcriptional regulator [Flavobacteriales bacterium]